MRRYVIFIFCCLFSLISNLAFAYGSEADHETLRNLLKQSAEAMNSGKFEALKPYLDENFTLITVDNNKFTSINKFKQYWDKTFNDDNAILTKLEFNPVADDKTYFISDNAGVVHGTAKETYHFKDGDVRNMETRWTAIVHKTNNDWKLLSVQFTGNILDNPILDALKERMLKVGLIGAAIGLVIGLFLMGMMRRKKS